jgi:hypothetical protein
LAQRTSFHVRFHSSSLQFFVVVLHAPSRPLLNIIRWSSTSPHLVPQPSRFNKFRKGVIGDLMKSGDGSRTPITAAMKRGQLLEPVARDRFANEYKVDVREVSIEVVDVAPWLTASADGVAIVTASSWYPLSELKVGEEVVLEFKCRTIFENKPLTAYEVSDELAYE